MTYEGIATLLIRFAALALLAYLMAGVVELVVLLAQRGEYHLASASLNVSWYVYVAGALLALAASRRLGRLMARGL